MRNTRITMKKIAIVGRPNVGKSTLFNRLVGRRLALVHNKPGMTRDRREAEGKLYDLRFKIVDTAGLADSDETELTSAMVQQTHYALNEADIILFLVDAREGCTPYDYELANLMRKHRKPLIVVANKCEGNSGDAGLAEASALGLGDVIPVSAEHGLGMADLYGAMVPYFSDELEKEAESNALSPASTDIDVVVEKPLQLAIVGRPNVGKSTLINKLIGENRLLTADIPGVTRDSITLDWDYKGRKIHIIDTAGIRRRARVTAHEEKLAVMDTQRSIQFAEVVVLVIDATAPFEKQDLTLAYEIYEEGRALVLALNKWDLVENKKEVMAKVEKSLEDQLAQAKGIPCIPLCAVSGQGLDRLMKAVTEIYDQWNVRVSTGKLNKWLAFVTSAHPAPMVKGRRIRLKYMTQIKTRPPTFAVFASQADELPESYNRYLINHLRKDFGIHGVPIRLFVRGGENPYDRKKK
jgi:GTP-binding protein